MNVSCVRSVGKTYTIEIPTDTEAIMFDYSLSGKERFKSEAGSLMASMSTYRAEQYSCQAPIGLKAEDSHTDVMNGNENRAKDSSVVDSWIGKQFVTMEQIFEKAVRLSRSKKISEEEIEINKMMEELGIKKWEDKRIGW